jgi:hypothetical protein
MTEPRYYVFDRKRGDLTTFSAVNSRYWVIDRRTGSPVDEYTTKRAAEAAARNLNAAGDHDD